MVQVDSVSESDAPHAAIDHSRGSGLSTAQTIAAAVGVVVIAGLIADLVLWPRDQLPPIAQVDVRDYFSAAYLDRAQAFRGVQSWLALAAATVFVAVPLLAALLWPQTGRPGGRLARWGDRRSGAPMGRGGPRAAATLACAILVLALIARLPLDLAMFLRARDVGLIVQGFGSWLADWALAALLMIAGLWLLALLCAWLVRRLRRTWWVVMGCCVILLAIAFQALAPVLIEPLFGDFKRVEQGSALAREIDRIAARSGVEAGEIYTVDAASRTTGANAYVSGLGSSKRVVIYDTLQTGFTPAERRSVIAHEFGHARHRDLAGGLVWFAFVALASFFAIDLLARRLAERRGVRFESPAGMAMVLAVALLCVALSQPAANAWSRAIEARADAFALVVTQRPDAAIGLERQLTIRNLARPQPPAAMHFLFGTHPTSVERIGMAVTVRRELAAGKVQALP